MTTCFLGIGTNLGDRVQNIIDARDSLRADEHCHSLTSSSLYMSSPVGYLDQPAFINCVYELEYMGQAEQLLELAQSIEQVAGRQRDPNNQNAPRIIDIDILLFGSESRDSQKLALPHPRMFERRFVMEPLLELRDDLKVAGELCREIYEDNSRNGLYDEQEIFRLGE